MYILCDFSFIISYFSRMMFLFIFVDHDKNQVVQLVVVLVTFLFFSFFIHDIYMRKSSQITKGIVSYPHTRFFSMFSTFFMSILNCLFISKK